MGRVQLRRNVETFDIINKNSVLFAYKQVQKYDFFLYIGQKTATYCFGLAKNVYLCKVKILK